MRQSDHPLLPQEDFYYDPESPPQESFYSRMDATHTLFEGRLYHSDIRAVFAESGIAKVVYNQIQEYQEQINRPLQVEQMSAHQRIFMQNTLQGTLAKAEVLEAGARDWLYFECAATQDDLEWMESYGLAALRNTIATIRQHIDILNDPPAPAKQSIFSKIGSWLTRGRKARQSREEEYYRSSFA